MEIKRKTYVQPCQRCYLLDDELLVRASRLRYNGDNMLEEVEGDRYDYIEDEMTGPTSGRNRYGGNGTLTPNSGRNRYDGDSDEDWGF